MGGDLRNAPDAAAPRLMVRALRDPDGANLDRVQMIKGWIDAEDETFERVYDIAVSGDRMIGEVGRAREPVGSAVDIDNATFTNMIGAATLEAIWEDPDFDPAEDAFYYVRVIEIPKPRWTTYDAAFYDIPLPDGVPPTTQHRAYTSPIWYSATNWMVDDSGAVLGGHQLMWEPVFSGAIVWRPLPNEMIGLGCQKD